MSTSAERQRKRRERLRQKGIVDVTVTIPRVHTENLRQFARSLRSGLSSQSKTERLLEVIKALKSVQSDLQEAGVLRAGVFGSIARGQNLPGSDIDILIDIDAKRIGDIVEYIKITDRIKKTVNIHCPDVEVDVADHATLKPRIRERARRDVIYAF